MSLQGRANEEGNPDKYKGYNSSTGKLEYMLGLERRRYDEVEMYLYGDYIRNDDLTLDKPVF